MDEQNSAQQVPGELVDTGPTQLDVLEARMTLLERELLDRQTFLRGQLADGAHSLNASRLAQLVDSLQFVDQRLAMLRQLQLDGQL